MGTICEAQVLKNGIVRRFTVTELERLQTLPDGYTKKGGATKGERIKAIGNGWTAAVIAEIFKKLK